MYFYFSQTTENVKLFVSALSLLRAAARRREEIKECLTTVKQVFVSYTKVLP